MLGDLHLIDLVFTNEGSQFGEALSARPTNADQQHVTPELADHAHCAGYCRGNASTFHQSFYNYTGITMTLK